MTDKTITENWESTKSALLEGLEGQKKETMSAVVDAKQRGGSFGHQLGSSA